MSYTTLSVDPDGYWDSSVKATTAAKHLETAGQHALKKLSGLARMGGDDDSGHTFAHGYDAQAASIFTGLGALCGALTQVAAGFGASAVSHANAEAANTPSVALSHTVSTVPSIEVVQFAHPACAYGGTNIFPEGWTFIQALVAASWPDGDTGKMRTGKTAWDALADDIDDVTSRYIGTLMQPLRGFQAPDIPAISEKVTLLETEAQKIAKSCRALAAGCFEYAAAVDEAHWESGRELAEFVITSAAAIGISVLLTPFTAGVSDLVGGAAVAVDAAITAGRVAETLNALLARVAPLLIKLGEVSRSGAALGAVAKSGIFVGKAASTTAIWTVGTVAGDLAGNAAGDSRNIGEDVVYSLAAGGFAEGGKVAGEVLSAAARRGMSGTARAAAGAAGEEIPEVGARSVADAAKPEGPKHSGPKHRDPTGPPAYREPVKVTITAGGIKAGMNGVGTGLGAVAGTMATGGSLKDDLPDNLVKDGAEGAIPVLEPKPAGLHAAPPPLRAHLK